MTWIESHVELGAHPKTKRLARTLGLSLPTAVGHLHYLWWWSIRYREDGDLSGMDDWEVADAAEWEGEPEAFVGALRSAGFVDPDGRLHDWHEYAGKLIDQRKRNAERMRAARSGQRTATADPRHWGPEGEACVAVEADTARADHVQRTTQTRVGLPYRTVPNRTEENVNPLGPPLPNAAGAASQTRAMAVLEAEAKPERTPPGVRAVPKPKSPQTTLPRDWEPGDGDWAWAEEHGLPRDWVLFETEKFVDHFTGEGTRKVDWPACWRNWLRRAPEFARGPRQAAPALAVVPTPIRRERGSRVVAAPENPIGEWHPTADQMAAVRRFGLSAEQVEVLTAEFLANARMTGKTARDWHGSWATRLRMVAETGIAQ